MVVKNRRDILAEEVSPEEQSIPASQQVPNSKHQCQLEEYLQHLALKISTDSFHLSEKEGFWDPGILLKACTKICLPINIALSFRMQ